MKTRLFEWAEKEGLTMQELAQITGYSRFHLSKIKHGKYPLTEAFVAKIVLNMGDWARTLFLPGVPPSGRTRQPSGSTSPRIPAEPALVRSEA